MPRPAAARAASIGSEGASPFLTEDQRAALDAALAKKKAEEAARPPSAASNDESSVHKPQLGKNPHHEVMKTKRDLQHDHHLSRRGKGTGKAKKSGAGGKFTWGKLVTDGEEEGGAMDRNDPNYNSEEEASVAFHQPRTSEIQAYKQAVSDLLTEYYSSGDINEAAVSLQELDHPEFAHYFVKRALTTALDKHDREREMTAVLLSALYNEVIFPDQMRRGFLSVVESLDDLKLDVPDAVELVSLFICRAVVDDVLPPSSIKRLNGAEGSLVAELKLKCEVHLDAKHSAERLQRCFGSGAGFKLDETKEAIAKMLQEYRSSGDTGEVYRLLQGLAVPFFHHEFVKQALLMAMDAEDAQQFQRLLAHLVDAGELTTSQTSKGFQRVADNLADIKLDNPAAEERFAGLVEAATSAGWLDESFSATPTTPGSVSAANGQQPFHPSVQAYKMAALVIIREYFDSGDAQEVAARLAELDEPGFHNIFVKHAVQLAMDRKDRERELVSTLLVSLTPDTISPDQMALGFTRLLAGADDLALDIPDAAHLLSLFPGRAVVDEVLPPKFLAEVVPHLPAGSLGVSVVQATGATLSARHAAERLANCWHGGALTLDQLKEDMATLLKVALRYYFLDVLKEYLVNSSVKDAENALHDLAVPHYHHEFVYRALLSAFEGDANRTAIERLLGKLNETGEVNQTQMSKGFSRVEGQLDDLVLDFVKAREVFDGLKQHALKHGWLQLSD
ncbi:hypothetical protein N2152v2_005159 [Parachlorella kessleri]